MLNLFRRDDTVQNTLGNAVSGAQVYYLTQPANTATLTPLATIYADMVGDVALNPQTTDGYGHAFAYLPGGVLYTIVYVYPNGSQTVYPDQVVGTPSILSPFGVVPTGTINGVNQTFTIPQVLNQATVWQNFPLIPGVGFTITAGGPGMIITYALAPQAGDYLYVQGY